MRRWRASAAQLSLPLFTLLLLFVVCGSAPTPDDVELIEPQRSWFTYGPDGHIGDVLPTLARQVSSGRHVSTGVGKLSFTVRSGSRKHQSGKHKSDFDIDVLDGPQESKQCVEEAAFLMEEAWHSKVPVRMRVKFADLGAPKVLANGGGTYFCRIRNMFDEILPIAAGEAILSRDLNRHKKEHGAYDVLITINNRANWYYGIDGRCPPNQYDLVTVLLHEMYHNLLFTGGIYVDSVKMRGGRIVHKARVNEQLLTRFDAFLSNPEGCSVMRYLKDRRLKEQTGLHGTELLAEALTNDRLYFSGGSGKMIKLWAPTRFDPKSSIYHLAPIAGDDKVMNPTVDDGHAYHSLGARILQMQQLYLDPQVKGAKRCAFPLSDPTEGNEEDKNVDVSKRSDWQDQTFEAPPHVYTGNPKFPVFNVPYGGFPLGWIIALSILGVILLLTLCVLLFCIVKKLKDQKGVTDITDLFSSNPSRSKSSSSKKSKPTAPVPDTERPYPPPPPPGVPGGPGGPGGMPGGTYATPTHTQTETLEGPYPGDPGMGGITPTPPGYPGYPGNGSAPGVVPGVPPSCKPSSRPPSSTRRSSSHRPSQPKSKAPSTRPPSSSKPRPSSSRPSSSKHKSYAPKTEDYFDCS